MPSRTERASWRERGWSDGASSAGSSARASARQKPLPARHANGRAAEALARACLEDHGFAVLWQNLRLGPLEIDLVARRGDLVVIVEVRWRGPGSFEKPLASLSFGKRRTLLRATRALYRRRLRYMPGVRRIRIDVAAVRLEGETPTIEWIAGALSEDDA